MAIDYDKRLQNLQARRFDNELNESRLTKAFSSSSIPKNIKYLMESMIEIDEKYNSRTIEAANKVQKHLTNGYNLHFNVAYRTQGSVMTSTNIKVHSDFDLLTIIDRYHFPGIGVPNNNPYTASEPNSDIKELRNQSEKIMEGIYDEVDKTGKKSISIFNKSLNRKVDIVFCFWYNSKEYEETSNGYYRGLYLFDFTKNEKILDYPFAHISQVNAKGDRTKDGSRKGIRLLKTLKADNEDIELTSFHLTTIVHSIDDMKLNYHVGKEIDIAKAISIHLEQLINDGDYRRSIKSPNGMEKPLKDDTVEGLKKIKSDLDELISDVQKELYLTYFERWWVI